MARPDACYHCGEPVPGGAAIAALVDGRPEPVCCVGCKAVAELIHGSGFGAYYAFRSAPGAAQELRARPSAFAHYDSDDLRSRYVHRDGELDEATVEIGGMYCAACVWLLEHALKREPGFRSVAVSPATRRAVVRWQGARLPFSRLLEAINEAGFRPRPLAAGCPADPAHEEYRLALKRLLVAAAAGMQVMMFAVALYAGDFFGIEAPIERFLRLVSLLATLPVVFFSARPFYSGAWRGLRAGAPGMDLPVAIAITAAFLASVRATLVDAGEIYFDSVAMFVLFLSATRFLEMRARHRSEDQAFALANLLPDAATRIVDGRQETVSTDKLRAGDVLRIRAGDVLPADGVVEDGDLSLDESFLTGEALPVRRATGSPVRAGSLNRAGAASVRVTRTGAATSLAEVARLLDRARADRPPVAQLADRIASRFVAGVLGLAALAGGAWLLVDPARAFEIVLATLVVTCPCALALATPAAFAAASSSLAARGFLLVRARLLEVLVKPATLVFDKTGTLTEGCPSVLRTNVHAKGWTAERCLAVAAALEDASEHVLARAFAGDAGRRGRLSATGQAVTAGCGVEGIVDGVRWRIGTAAFVAPGRDSQAHGRTGDEARTLVFLGKDDGIVATFEVGDALREDAVVTVSMLMRLGFRVVIASGDRTAAVRAIAARLGVRDWRAEMLPADKVAFVHALRERGEKVVMVGDGVNDAPVLAAADASIALDAGTALARAAADAVVLGQRLGSVIDGIEVARATRRIVRQNLRWAIAYNLTAVPLAASGMLAPWMAALGMSLSSLVVVLNALRLNRRPLDGVRAEPRVPLPARTEAAA